MLINNISISQREEYQILIFIIDGQNLTQITEYKQLNNTNQWNPCIPMPFDDNITINISFVDNIYNNFRNWYPLQICDYPYNFVNYKNEYLFYRKGEQDLYEGKSLNIHNLSIHDYIINYNRNYPIARNTPHKKVDISLHYGSFINISSVTTDALFYVSSASKTLFSDCLFSNISAEIMFYNHVKYFFFHICFVHFFLLNLYIFIYRMKMVLCMSMIVIL